MSKTQDNLKVAFAGESQANRKYLAFAKKAEMEGKPNLAKLFQVAAEGETVHALNHLNALGGVKSSEENLQSAIKGETYEIETMYPGFLKEAEEENENTAKRAMNIAMQVEKNHQHLFQEALKISQGGKDIEEKEYYVCQVCGYPAIGEAPDKCPVCGAPKEKFKKM